jgi:hypothetical protein
MARRALAVLGTAFVLVTAVGPAVAWACGGLVNPNGTVTLLKTTTLAGYRNGMEHYVTSFQFAGGGGEFGSIVPLPGVPTKVVRGGDWTLQRLVQEVQPPVPAAAELAFDAARAASEVEILLETRIDALDITILKGGGDAVGTWAREQGFVLTPDAPEVLDFYADRSPIFMAARFDASAAEDLGQDIGDGTPIHLTIPTDRPWVPLRILALGLQGLAPVQADVFLLTERAPALLPEPIPFGDVFLPNASGMFLQRSEAASEGLLADLRSDKGMKWIPKDPSGMWLTYLRLDTTAQDLRYDLAIDASGAGRPSPVDAGLVEPGPAEALFEDGGSSWWMALVAGPVAAAVLAMALRRGRGRRIAL